MPRIPTYQPNQVRPVEAVETRFRAANDGGGAFGALGEGLQKLGIAADKYATVEDGIQDHFDDTYSRQLALEYQAAQSPVLTQYGTTQGKGAIDLAAQTQEQLTKLRDDTLAKASNPRMKRYLQERLAEPFTKAMSTVTGHSLQQQVVMAENTALSERGVAIDEAAGSFADPKLFDAAKNRALAANAELGRLKGWSSEQAKAENLSLTTKIHQGAVDVMLSQTDPDLDMVAAYAAAHKDEMTSSAYAGVLKDLQAPMQERAAENDFRSAIAGMPSPAAASPGAKVVAAKGGVPSDIVDYFVSQGFSPAVAKGIAGGIMSESSGDHKAVNKTSGAFGLGQWLGPRKAELFKRYGSNPTRQQQLEFLAWELKGGDGGGASVRSQKSASGAAEAYIRKFMRPGSNEVEDGVQRAIAHAGGGTVSSDPEAPRTWDKDATYNAIDRKAKAEGWSFERTERAKRRADKVISTDESLLKRQEDAADKSAAEIILAKGANFKSINMIPADIRSKMSIGARASAEAAIERNNQPVQAKPNGPTAKLINQVRQLQPEVFATTDLSKFVGLVSDAEMDTYLTDQARMKRDNGDTVKRRSEINAAVDTMSKFGQVKLDEADRATIGSLMENMAVAAQAAGKPVDHAAFYRSALATVMAMPRIRAEK